MNNMLDSILLIDDETLFHLVFEDACSLLNISLSLKCIDNSDEAELYFKNLIEKDQKKPDCIFVDLNIIGSSFDGIELVRRINYEYGNGVVVGIISSSADQKEIDNSLHAGAQFWIVKSDEIEPRLEDFRSDYDGYKNRTQSFRVYR